MAKKPVKSSNVTENNPEIQTMDDVIETANNVVHTRFNRSIVDVPDMGLTVAKPIKFRTVIVDRRAGSTNVEEVYGAKSNLEVVAENMKVKGAREAASRFFLEGRLVQIIESNISTATVKRGEAVSTRDGLIKSINGAISQKEAANIVCEFVIPVAYECGIINETTKITNSIVYGAKTVELSDLSLDLVAQNAVRTAEAINIKMPGNEKMSKQSFARAFSECMQVVGYDLHRAVAIQHLFDDMAKAVRVKLLSDSGNIGKGAIDQTWLDNPIIEELCSNVTFVKAALSYPASGSISTVNDIHTLNRDAPLAIASLKSSRRYAMMTDTEYLSTYGKKTITGIDGAPLFFVGWREASIQKVAQNVSVFPDVLMPSLAVNIIPGPDNASKFVAASHPSGAEASVGYHINQLLSTLQHLAESNDPRIFSADSADEHVTTRCLGETFVFGDDGLGFAEELAFFLSREVYLRPDDSSENGYSWVYVVETNYTHFNDLSWQISLTAAKEFITDQIGLVFLLTQDMAPKAEVTPRAQLLSEKALFTRVVNMPDGRVIDAKRRFGFAVNLGGTTYQGNVHTTDVGLHELPIDSKFVIPLHNELVIDTINAVHESISEVLKGAGDISLQPFDEDNELNAGLVAISPATVTFLKQAQVRSVLKMSQSVSSQYRQVVTSLMRMRALTGKSYSEAVRARGALYQDQFMAYSDLVSLSLILMTSGMNIQFIRNVLEMPEAISVIMLYGSDRTENKRV